MNGKHKGSAFENRVLKDVRDVIDVAYKSLGSGNTADEKGDIITRCFMIECKHHRSFTDGEIDKYWRKLVVEAKRESARTGKNKEPILVFKENRREPLVMFFDYYRLTYRIMLRYNDWLCYLREKGEVTQ